MPFSRLKSVHPRESQEFDWLTHLESDRSLLYPRERMILNPFVSLSLDTHCCHLLVQIHWSHQNPKSLKFLTSVPVQDLVPNSDFLNRRRYYTH